ncbi:HNH endonuclease [Glycomyces sp. NPDC048151]|uniref:HNH endonuclease n=1 Tax=Glycomyces sp. NPDC048151 TaxID=3364002 RepID=UPI0037228787
MGDWPRREHFPRAIRAAILRRDRVCRICGGRPATIADHRTPVAEGGAHTLANGQGVCEPCHDAKTAGEIRRGYKRWSLERRPRLRRNPEAHPGRLEL